MHRVNLLNVLSNGNHYRAAATDGRHLLFKWAGNSAYLRQEYLTMYILLYIFPAMTARAKLFQNGGSQAVRLPKSCRFPETQQEVVVRREGRRVVIEPLDEWPPEFIATLGAWKEAIERPPSRRISKLKDPFAAKNR